METFRDLTSTTDDISDIPLIYNKIGTGWALDPPTYIGGAQSRGWIWHVGFPNGKNRNSTVTITIINI